MNNYLVKEMADCQRLFDKLTDEQKREFIDDNISHASNDAIIEEASQFEPWVIFPNQF